MFEGKIVKIQNCFSRIPLTSKLLFIAGSIGILFLFYMSKVYWRVSWYSEPDFSFSFLSRTFIISVSIFAVLYSITTDAINSHIDFNLYHQGSILAVLSISIFSLMLIILLPEVACSIGEEDGIIEWMSFIVLFSNLFLIVRILSKTKRIVENKMIIIIALLFFGFLFFFMCMEEISWGQRILGFQTPDLFATNSQKEVNFHNFDTTEVDTLYYIGFCILLIYLPFIRLNFPNLFSIEFLRIFISGPFIIIPAVLTFAFHYNKWNLLFTQIWFFSAIFVLLIIAFSKPKSKFKNYFLVTAIILITIQVIILLSDRNNPVLLSGRIAEYKELLSQIALFIYTVDVYIKIRKLEPSNNWQQE